MDFCAFTFAGDIALGPNAPLNGSPSLNPQNDTEERVHCAEGSIEPSSSDETNGKTEYPASKMSKLDDLSVSEVVASTENAGASLATEIISTATTSVEGATASPENLQEKSPLQSVYHIKWVRFKESLYPVVTQNENGPCPLLAIVNMLILQGKVKMPAMVEMVTSGQLMEYLADCIFEHAPKVYS